VALEAPAVIAVADQADAARLRFRLPAGTYATVLIEALGVTVDNRRGALGLDRSIHLG
jgi:tRNA(Glu) U13 pseudouridine synthase TruD